MILYAATTNPGKLSEFTASASTFGVQVLALPGLADMPAPVEDAPTYIGNAEKKAAAYSLLAPGLLVFADDSGLEVDALNGEPGVYSARFADLAGYDLHSGRKTDDRNNDLLLDRLRSTSAWADRSARFVCSLALARDGEILLRSNGTVHGEIRYTARGTDGFGYDPLFFLPSLQSTMAELSREQKWLLSHRGRAFRALLPQLHTLPTT